MSNVKDLIKEFGITFPKGLDQSEIIVIIEDQTDLRLIVAHHLNKLGYKNVKQFSGAMDAIKWLRNTTQKISLIICDHEMPYMNGFDFLQELKSDTGLKRGPFAITIDNPNREKIMLATENGVDGVLVKPFTLKDIIPKLRQAFSIYHNPDNPELLYEAAKRLIIEENYDIAEKIYQGLALVSSKTARPMVGLAFIKALKGDSSIAEKLFAEAEKRNPNYIHTYVERGEFFAKQGKIEQGLEEFKRAIELSPLNPVRYEKAAALLFSLKRYQEAIDLLNMALANDLKFPSLYHYLSQGHYSLKDYKKAIKYIKSALSEDSSNINYLNQLGVSYKESDQGDEALKTYNSIIKIDPENKAALFNKAILLKFQDNFTDAVKVLERIISIQPDFAQAKEKLSECQQAIADASANKKAG